MSIEEKQDFQTYQDSDSNTEYPEKEKDLLMKIKIIKNKLKIFMDMMKINKGYLMIC